MIHCYFLEISGKYLEINKNEIHHHTDKKKQRFKILNKGTSLTFK